MMHRTLHIVPACTKNDRRIDETAILTDELKSESPGACGCERDGIGPGRAIPAAEPLYT